MARTSALADLLVKLSLDPALRRRFQEDPSALKDEAGLDLLPDADEELFGGRLGWRGNRTRKKRG